jgi:protein-L-isoaspartate(D-aspartate) O-methyltransferase
MPVAAVHGEHPGRPANAPELLESRVCDPATSTTANSMDIEQARFNMVEQQIRPWYVLDQDVLDLLFVVRREEFVPPAYRALAFTDMEIPLDVGGVRTGECMLAPKVEARLLQHLEVRKHETVVEVGAGSGYMAALLAHRGQRVRTYEIRPELADFARENLRRAGISNVEVVTGNGAVLLEPGDETFDVILLSGAIQFIPPALFDRLKPGGRVAAIVGEEPVFAAQIIRKQGDRVTVPERLFETATRPLHGFPRRAEFAF